MSQTTADVLTVEMHYRGTTYRVGCVIDREVAQQEGALQFAIERAARDALHQVLADQRERRIRIPGGPA